MAASRRGGLWRGLLVLAFAAAVLGSGLLWLQLSRMGWLRTRPPSAYRVAAIEIDEEPVLWMVKRSWIAEMWVHHIRVGEVVPFHRHPLRAEMVAVLRGRARVRGLRPDPDGGEPIVREEVLGAGHLVFSPAGQVHEYANAGDEPLWCLVVQSPPFVGNPPFGEGDVPSDDDFLVVPVFDAEPPRAAEIPPWARGSLLPWRGEFRFFPGMPGRLHRGREIESGEISGESWMVLMQGEGTLSVGGSRHEVRAPTWVRAPGGSWSLRSASEVVALEIRVPVADAGLFLVGVRERLFGR